jgi:hypothetical protein
MTLRQAIIEQWEERFGINDPSFIYNKIEAIKMCTDTSQLLYHCMNIDIHGHHLIADKIQMSHRDFAFFLSSFRALDQGHIYTGGEDGFYYKETITIKKNETIQNCVYPDETIVTYVFTE